LHHVRRVDAPGQAAVYAQGNHALQPPTVPREQLLAGLRVAAAGLFKQQFGIGVVGSHHAHPPLSLIPQNDRKGYGVWRPRRAVVRGCLLF
jgi:hypothetical protein